ncbi:MAG TPA: hypothetical protein VF639_23110 [Hymenobacter sp.]|jgi:energy-coupling factor transporter transmembrane protein EcfT
MFEKAWTKAATRGTWVVATVAGFVLPMALNMPAEVKGMQKLSTFIVVILILTLFEVRGRRISKISYKNLSLRCLALGVFGLLFLIFVYHNCTCYCDNDKYYLKGFAANTDYPAANFDCNSTMVEVDYQAKSAWTTNSIALCHIGLVLFFVGTICAFSTSLVAALYAVYRIEDGESGALR